MSICSSIWCGLLEPEKTLLRKKREEYENYAGRGRFWGGGDRIDTSRIWKENHLQAVCPAEPFFDAVIGGGREPEISSEGRVKSCFLIPKLTQQIGHWVIRKGEENFKSRR